MNAPDRFESFMVPPDVKKLEAVRTVPGMKNSLVFRIEREDHTMGNMLRTELHKNPKVIFSGYKIPHPLQHHLELYIQTSSDYSPVTALNDALGSLISNIGFMKTKFEMGINPARTNKKQNIDAGNGPGGLFEEDDIERAAAHRQGIRENRRLELNNEDSFLNSGYNYNQKRDISPIGAQGTSNYQGGLTYTEMEYDDRMDDEFQENYQVGYGNDNITAESGYSNSAEQTHSYGATYGEANDEDKSQKESEFYQAQSSYQPYQSEKNEEKKEEPEDF